MNRELKHALQSAFKPPKLMKKDVFLRELNYPKTRYQDFFMSQIGYIRKRIWCFSVLLVMSVFIATLCIDRITLFSQNTNQIWIIGATLPFLALLSVTELSRSDFYNMAELEMSCRYSLSNVVITRATILGVANFLLFIVILTVVSKKNDYGLLRLSLYTSVPYLISCIGSLLVLNKVRAKESIYYCGSITCFVSIMNSILSATKQLLYTEEFVFVWIAVFTGCIFTIFIQMNQFIKRTEEAQWNLLLTD